MGNLQRQRGNVEGNGMEGGWSWFCCLGFTEKVDFFLGLVVVGEMAVGVTEWWTESDRTVRAVHEWLVFGREGVGGWNWGLGTSCFKEF